MKILLIILISAITLFAMEPLVSAKWLKEAHNDKNLVIIDVSDSKLFEKGHIPGSINSPISQWREKHENYLLVKNADAIQKEFSAIGINKKSKVIVYSHHDNAKDILKASYVLWAMEYYGFENSAMLDGGLPAWKAHKETLSTTNDTTKKGNFKVAENKALVADLAFVKEQIGKSNMLDARPSIFYFGAQKQSVLKKAGHIPKAHSYFWKYSFDGDYLKSKDVLKEMLVEGMGFDPEKPMITYCTGGLETSMNFFVLHRILGFDNIRLYDASMKEWGNRSDTPMIKYRWE